MIVRVFDFLDRLEALEQSGQAARKLPQVQALSGYPELYRARIGRYRIGFEIHENEIILHSVGTRGDFYQSFPPRAPRQYPARTSRVALWPGSRERASACIRFLYVGRTLLPAAVLPLVFLPRVARRRQRPPLWPVAGSRLAVPRRIVRVSGQN